jgi:hypothetical protein
LQAAINALYEETGDASVYLSKTLPEYVTTDEGRVDLSYEQKRQFNSVRGDAYELASAGLEGNAFYQSLPKDMRREAYAFAKDYAVQTAKDSLNVGYDPSDWVDDAKGMTPEELGEMMVQKAVETSAGSKKYENKYDGLAQMLEAGTIGVEAVVAALPNKQKNGYSNFIQGSDIEMDDYLDVIEYYNGDGIKQEDVKAYIEKGFSNDRDRCRVWQCFYSKNTIPKEWQ